ncbi:GrpB family protein [Gilvimarinus sp. F26214L]|uniref:GrpB family protein n=1 Tax=Gilvimarinus sp. DZF01 TaxID=3461371 RepID=UPI004045DE01
MPSLFSSAEIRAATSAVYASLRSELLQLLPNANIQEIGSSSIVGALTKGDVDILVCVPESQFNVAVAAMLHRFETNTGMEDVPQFASFKGVLDDVEFGIQLACDHCQFGFVAFRDRLNSSPDLVEEYNRVKLAAAGLSMKEYRDRKWEFIERVLSAAT